MPTTVTGPISGGKHGWPFAASIQDVSALGYVEAEYFLAGDATRYKTVADTELGADGFWQAEPAGTAAFKTRFLVYRPADAAKFNGTVIVTWNNVTAGHDLFGAGSAEIFEGGYAIACVTTQKVGIVGLPPANQGLSDWDSERYGDLHHPGDDYSFDVFTQAAQVVGRDRDTSGIDPMAGLNVERVIAQGASQSAGRLGTYVNAIAPLTDAFDGYILTIYFGRGTPLEVGDTVVNINAPQTETPQRRLQGVNRLRDDLAAPVFVVNSELEAIACFGVRQPDTDKMRFWEVAGTCHVSHQARVIRQQLIDRDQLVSRPIEPGINRIPMNPIYDASYHHMHRWLKHQEAPPVTPRIEFEGSEPAVVRDEHGIAKGGIRLPQADVPLGQNSSIPVTPDIFAVLGGSSVPFDAEKILSLYGSKQEFLAKFKAATEFAIEAGVVLPRELPGLFAEAEQTWTALVGSV
jgi:hypothetical protein